MAVFVTDGAKGAVSILSRQFVHTTIAVYQQFLALTADLTRLAVLVQAEPPLVGPDAVVVAAIVHALAGIDYQELVDIAVAIPVVGRPVYAAGFKGVHHVKNQILGVLIVRRCAPVFIAAHVQLDIVHVERQTELPIALGIEIIIDGAIERRLREMLLIEDALPQGHRGGLVVLEGLIAESHQHNQLAAVAQQALAGVSPAWCPLTGWEAFLRQLGTATTPVYAIGCRSRQRDIQQQQDT